MSRCIKAATLATLLVGLHAQMLPVASDYRSLSTALRPLLPDIVNDIKLTGAAYRGTGRLPTNSVVPKALLEDLLVAVKMSDAAYEGEVFPTYNVTVRLTVAGDIHLRICPHNLSRSLILTYGIYTRWENIAYA